MYRLNMNLQISLCRSLMVTLITRIFDLTLLASTVYQAKQKLENISQGKVFLSKDFKKFSQKISWIWSCPHRDGL